MSIWISNKFVKFHVKRLNRSKNIPIIKVLGGLLFLNTLYVPYYVSRRFTVSRAQTITSARNNLQGDTFPPQLKSSRAQQPVGVQSSRSPLHQLHVVIVTTTNVIYYSRRSTVNSSISGHQQFHPSSDHLHFLSDTRLAVWLTGKWYHFQWPWVTSNPHFKVTIIFNVKWLD